MSKPIDQNEDVNTFSDSENEGGGYPIDESDKDKSIKDFDFPGNDSEGEGYPSSDSNDGSQFGDGSDYPGAESNDNASSDDDSDSDDEDEDEDKDDEDEEEEENAQEDGKKDIKSARKRDATGSGQKSKLKTYALVGGIGVVVVSLMGGAVMYKSSLAKNRGTPSQSIPMDVVPVEAPIEPVVVKPQPKAKPQATAAERNMAPISAIAAVNSENTPKPVPYVRPDQAAQANPPAQPEQYVAIAQPSQLDQPGEVVEPVPPPMFVKASDEATEQEQSTPSEEGDDSSSEISTKQFDDLQAKADMLAQVMLRSQDRVNTRIDEAIAAQEKAAEAIEDHEKRITALEEAITDLREAIEGLTPKKKAVTKSKPAPKAKATVKESKKAEPSKGEDEKDYSPTPSIRMKVEPIRAKAKSGKSANVQGYSVVATYPSTNPGVAPERAWVTNGEKLVEVTVGSSVSGARVTKIDGTNVHTSAGTIRVAR